MLFTPWRNEETDLLSNVSSYSERYLLLKDAIEEQKKQYAICTDDLTDIEKKLEAIEDENTNRFDHLAPVTLDNEHRDETNGMQDLHLDYCENYDLSDDLGIPSAVSNAQEELIVNEVKDHEYRQMVRQLNKEQKEFFHHILHQIKTSDEPFYSFLSGGAGVGKSHVTKALY